MTHTAEPITTRESLRALNWHDLLELAVRLTRENRKLTDKNTTLIEACRAAIPVIEPGTYAGSDEALELLRFAVEESEAS